MSASSRLPTITQTDSRAIERPLEGAKAVVDEREGPLSLVIWHPGWRRVTDHFRRRPAIRFEMNAGLQLAVIGLNQTLVQVRITQEIWT